MPDTINFDPNYPFRTMPRLSTKRLKDIASCKIPTINDAINKTNTLTQGKKVGLFTDAEWYTLAEIPKDLREWKITNRRNIMWKPVYATLKVIAARIRASRVKTK